MNNENLNETNVLRIWDVKRRIGLSKSTIYRLIAKRDFPKRIRLSTGTVGWVDADLRAWIQERRTPLE